MGGIVGVSGGSVMEAKFSGATWRDGLKDSSTVSLILSNVVTIVFALAGGWGILTIMWVYWSQSVIIGFFNFLRILSLQEFSTKGLKINHASVDATTAAKVFTAFFFAFHYGFFHLVYAIFLGVFSAMSQSGPSFLDVAPITVMFLLNHGYSFLHNRGRDRGKNLGALMMFPYARIIPMHLTIIFGGMFLSMGVLNQLVLLLFLTLKTAADVAMHLTEHS